MEGVVGESGRVESVDKRYSRIGVKGRTRVGTSWMGRINFCF